ncbi:MAG: acyl-CoA dehydrogenase [Micavibrio sp.]|nr:acyl-CoA dehydrogenase [Micavibrio sp.]
MIDLLPDADQRQIIDSIAGYLGNQFPVSRLSTEYLDGENEHRDSWKGLAEQGLFGLSVAENMGGAGFTLVEDVLAAREFGRFLLSPSVLASSLAAHVAATAGDAELAAAIIDGSTRVSFARLAGPGRIGVRIVGEIHLVDAHPDDLLLGWGNNGIALFARAGLADLRSVTPMDGSVRLERAWANGLATRIFLPTSTAPLARRANLMMAAAQAGNADATCKMAVEYAKVREQFGKPIGAFQAIAHHCADMAIRARAASAQTAFASIAVRDGRADADLQIASASLVASDAALRNATIAIRVHGGMGFTAECDVHLYLKRAHLLDHLNGGARLHQEKLLSGTFTE